VVCLYIPTVMAAVHNQAKRSACTLRFHVATEGAWDVGCGSGCLVAALLSALGVLSVAILLSLLGALALFVLLRRYYASHPRDDGRCARSARAERHRQSGRER
jgi:DHA1 family inner membrane transport protein